MNASIIQLQLSVLAEPNRFKIVELLRSGPNTVSEIVEALHMGQPQVSRHLRLLFEAGLVKTQKNAQQRIYSLEAAPFQNLHAWLTSFSKVWDERIDNLDMLLADLKENAGAKSVSSKQSAEQMLK